MLAQLKGVLLKPASCVAYAPVDFDGQVGVMVEVSPPTYTNSFGWFYTWPAASTLNMALKSSIPFVR